MFRRLRAENPVSWHELPGEHGLLVVVKHEDVVEVNRDAERFSSENGGVMLMDPDGATASTCAA